MKFNAATSCTISVAFLSTLVAGKPLKGPSQCSVALQGENKTSSFGAVYFINNEAKGNFIVSHDIQSDGTLQFSRGTYAGGRGLHGDNSPDATGPDALFSQGAVKVAGQNLFVVNPGSDTIAMFAIDPSMPSNLTMVGDPVSSGGNFPVSLAVSPKTGNVCVANGGETNGVQCFTQNATSGLTEIQNTRRSLNLNQTTPPNGPANTVSHIVFSEDGSQLIASVKGLPPNTKGFLAVWDVSDEDGTLSADFAKSSPGNGGLLPFSMTVIKGKNAVLNTDAAAGFSVFDFSSKASLAAGNTSSIVTKIDGQVATCWSAFSSKTGTFFLTDIGTSKVTEVSVDDNLQAKIVKQYAQQSGSATIDLDVATVGDNDFAYVLAPNATSIAVLQLGNGAGQAQNLQQFNFADAAKKAGVTIDANNLQGMTVFVKSF